MKENPLQSVMNAHSIAFFGASNNPFTMGTTQITHLIRGGFQGNVWPVNPREKTVLGVTAYRRVADLPEVPDLAVLVLPTRIVPEILDECGRKGIRRAVIISGGFKERGEKGEELEEELKSVAKRHGIRFVGPNCIGVINARRNLNLTFYPYTNGPGPMGILSQSGTFVTQVLPYLAKRGIRYSRAISLGNEADIDLVDGIEYLSEDPETRAIALYIEGIRRGRDFVETVKGASMKKPVVAYYVGGTEAGARSGLSHTGAMGGNDIVHDCAFRQCGIVRAPTIELLYDWAWALATTPIPKGRRVAIVSHSGGPVTSMADACARNDMEVPLLSENTQGTIAPMVPETGSTANPVDMTFNTNPEALMDSIPKAIFQSGEVDAILIHGIGGSDLIKTMKTEAPDLVPADISDVETQMVKMHHGLVELREQMSCPVVASSFDDHTDAAVSYVLKNDIPVYPSPERAVQAMAAVMRYGEWRRSRENHPC